MCKNTEITELYEIILKTLEKCEHACMDDELDRASTALMLTSAINVELTLDNIKEIMNIIQQTRKG